MNVLIIGGGGREHALAWKIARSPRLGQLYCAPGNAGTASIAENLDIPADDIDALCAVAEKLRIDLTVVGPEGPLAAGIVDRFTERMLPVIGPSRAAARIEADKAYAKELMNRALVPTADAKIFDSFDRAREYVATRENPLVVKAAGLAQGKGVILCPDPADALIWIERIMVGKLFGDAGKTVVVEETLTGREISVLALVDGENIKVPETEFHVSMIGHGPEMVDAERICVLETARDYKPIGDGDTGPNTGGMGAYSPAETLDDTIMGQIQRDILVPTVAALRRDDAPYRGVLYAGLMLTPGGPKVLEFNCRFGDPETQPLLMRLRSDLLEVFCAMLEGTLDRVALDWDPRPAVGVVMASGGYPGDYAVGKPITGLDAFKNDSDVAVFHAGTQRGFGNILTSGGRVLCATALGDSLADARARAYDAVQQIHFDGAQFRTDIAAS
jgi:phosphoribosylamine--glycine ligase